MANTKSIQKIRNYLDDKQEVLSVSQVCQGVNLRYETVKEVLQFLQGSGEVQIISNGKTTLIQLKNTGQRTEQLKQGQNVTATV